MLTPMSHARHVPYQTKPRIMVLEPSFAYSLNLIHNPSTHTPGNFCYLSRLYFIAKQTPKALTLHFSLHAVQVEIPALIIAHGFSISWDPCKPWMDGKERGTSSGILLESRFQVSHSKCTYLCLTQLHPIPFGLSFDIS
jgi:hypothetical protein